MRVCASVSAGIVRLGICVSLDYVILKVMLVNKGCVNVVVFKGRGRGVFV